MKSDVFEDIINQINDGNIKRFTIQVINSLDSEFFKLKTSTTGKHHPPECNVEGGIIKHIQRVCYFAHLLIDSHRFDSLNIKGDIILSACLLHDIGKKSEYVNYQDYLDHPIRSFNIAERFCKHLDPKIWKILGNCILFHMGNYGPKKLQKSQYNLLELIVYTADYFASRKEIIIHDD